MDNEEEKKDFNSELYHPSEEASLTKKKKKNMESKVRSEEKPQY